MTRESLASHTRVTREWILSFPRIFAYRALAPSLEALRRLYCSLISKTSEDICENVLLIMACYHTIFTDLMAPNILFMDFSAVVYVIANKIYIQVCMEHLKAMEIKLYNSFVFQIRLNFYLCLSLNNSNLSIDCVVYVTILPRYILTFKDYFHLYTLLESLSILKDNATLFFLRNKYITVRKPVLANAYYILFILSILYIVYTLQQCILSWLNSDLAL